MTAGMQGGQKRTRIDFIGKRPIAGDHRIRSERDRVKKRRRQRRTGIVCAVLAFVPADLAQACLLFNKTIRWTGPHRPLAF